MGSVERVYDSEYFSDKTPFKNILSKLCDLEIDSYRRGSYSYGSVTQYYNISYDMTLFIQNVKEIKQGLLKTKMCKYLEEIREKVESIPESIDEYKNAHAIGRIISDLILDGCIKHTANSCRYNWDIKNRYSDNIDFNIFCANRMKRPLIRLFEVNGWERESWMFYFDFPMGEELELWKVLSERFDKMDRVNQVFGQSYFELKFVPLEYEDINWGASGSTYMAKHNMLKGKLNVDTLKEVLTYTDNGLFEFFYKGGIGNLFE